MRIILFLILVLLSIKSARAKTEQRAILQLASSAYKLHVTKNENFFVATRAGEVASSKSINSYWHKIDPVKTDVDNTSKGLFDNVNFFNSDTGFVSGFIYNTSDEKYDIIYKTKDGGKTWKSVNFGQSGWVDDAVNLDNGEAWLSVAGSGIAYTPDFGNTWKAFKIPEIRQRFAAIYFNLDHEGIIGSLWDMIAVTNDNCENWKLIPTPLDQKKYKKTNVESRPEINKVAFFKTYILCLQEGMVFYSRRDSINWTLLPGYVSFYTDAENSALYFLNNKNYFVKSREDFNPIFISSPIDVWTSSECKNANLFIFCGNRIIEFGKNNSIFSSFLYTNQRSEIKPTEFGAGASGAYGRIGNKIFLLRHFTGEWKYVNTLPFETDSGQLSLLNDNTIVFLRNDDSVFYFNMLKNKLTRKSKSSIIQSFCKAGIKKIIFEKGSSGCFHSYADKLVYEFNDGSFQMKDPISSGTNHKSLLPENNDEIESSDVDKFIKQLPQIIYQNSTIETLGFTEKEYERCRHDIKEFQKSVEEQKRKKKLSFQFPRNNIDFPRLISMVDSIKEIDSVTLNKYLLGLNEMWSTTANWTKFTLLNNNDEELQIENLHYEPNAFYFPWSISLNGLKITNTNIAINHFLEKVYPSFLDNKDRVEILHTLVKKLY